ncbi:MAG: hypothetical protein JWP10_1091 [Nocardioidaceae bacterium]|nr:hypothetical protein [Nocardioidaceae bacterium]
MKKLFARRNDRGMSTAEYAVGTVGACTIGGVLVKVGQSEWFGDLIRDIVMNVPDLVSRLF